MDLLTKLNCRIVIQPFGPGPANAIRYGFAIANSKCVVVTMADGSDDVSQIDSLVNLVNRGCAVASASRYTKGGKQIGGPRIKRFLSRLAGFLLHFLAGVGTLDSTNSFKAYDKKFVEDFLIHSRSGFEIGIEMIAKAHRSGNLIGEIPTTWIDRSTGQSNFRIFRWLSKYFFWFRFAFGKRLSKQNMHVRLEKRKFT